MCSPGISASDFNRPLITSNLLKEAQQRLYMYDESAPEDFTPTPQLCNVTRAGIEMSFQLNDTREEFIDLVSNGGRFLKICLSKDNFDKIVSELCHWHKRRGWSRGWL